MLGCITRIVKTRNRGARILGAHIEGPYLNERQKGSHDARFHRTPGTQNS